MSPRTVLVVDDNEANRYAVTFWLREAGLATLDAGSGAEAIRLATEQRPDLVVLDIRLPDFSGFEVARALKKQPETASIPILHLSASFTSAEWRTHGLELGAEAYLTHPVEPRELVATVRTLLRVRDVEEQLRAAAAEAQAAAARATALQEVTAALAGAMTARSVGAIIVEHALRLTDAAAVFLALYEGVDAVTVELVGARRTGGDITDAIADEWRQAAADGSAPLAVAARLDGPLALPTRAMIDTAFPAWHVAFDALDARSLFVVPLRSSPAIVGQPTLGALVYVWTREHAATWHDDALAAAIAEPCAQALERARLYETAQHARADAEAARERAEIANRTKAEFLANMSHELRTPLNAIGGYAELMELGVRGPVTDEQRADLARLQKAQRHLLGLINDLLNFAKLDAGRVQFEPSAVRVDDVVDSVEPLVRPQLDAKGIRFDVRPCSPDVRVWADEEKLRQVLVNLLGNSLKYTAAGGTVRVACETIGERVTIRVTDTGVGIPADKLRDIFDPFVQVGRGGAPGGDGGGVGLGLAISREIVEAMGGQIWAESEVGVGSTFVVELPRRSPMGLTPA